jgi:hypothetical protein
VVSLTVVGDIDVTAPAVFMASRKGWVGWIPAFAGVFWAKLRSLTAVIEEAERLV